MPELPTTWTFCQTVPTTYQTEVLQLPDPREDGEYLRLQKEKISSMRSAGRSDTSPTHTGDHRSTRRRDTGAKKRNAKASIMFFINLKDLLKLLYNCDVNL